VTLQKVLNIRFRNPSLLQQALIHSSYANENPNTAPFSNERLEFLGDAVLGMIISEKLYELLPGSTEGELTRLRSTLVCRNTLYRIAKTIGLDQFLYLGKGEKASGGYDKSTNLAGALEAVIGAIFLDNGYRAATDFIIHIFDTDLKESAKKTVGIDYKSQLQQLMQSRQHETPVYHITQTSGSSHKPVFTVEVCAGNVMLGRGYGTSKKIAEVEAARSALEQLE
jgi:ribonuclease-3